jgi:hypothetical protein
MPESASHLRRISQDTPPPQQDLKCPATGPALLSWLAITTPIGAPSLALGVADAPLTRPPAARVTNWGDESRVRVEGLLAVLRDCLGREDVAEATYEQVAPAPRIGRGEQQGTPVYWRDERHLPRTDLGRAEKLGLDLRALGMTVMRDLAGESPASVASMYGRKATLSITGGSESRAVRRYVNGRGAPLLAALGAWPWTHAESGRLPRGWWTSPTFLEPLAAWHRAAWTDARQRLADAAQTFADGEVLRHRRSDSRTTEADYLRDMERAPRVQTRPRHDPTSF